MDFFTLMSDKIGHQREQLFPYVREPFLRKTLTNYGYSWAEINVPLFRYFGYQMVVKNGLIRAVLLYAVTAATNSALGASP